jgi:hypothetical protein
MLMLLDYFSVWSGSRLDEEIEAIKKKYSSAPFPPEPSADGPSKT